MGIRKVAKRAVFLDRDGVINRLALDPATDEYESPHDPKDLKLYPWSINALKELQNADYILFIVSNQPSYAKGKTSLKSLKAVHAKFHRLMKMNGIKFKRYFYCYHHPDGVVAKYAVKCRCRKPKPYFILKAVKENYLDASHSWFIGDRDIDVLCGRAGGTMTILVDEKRSRHLRGESSPDFRARNLKEAVKIIVKRSNK
jgi:D-glycero-D-manno-heptose 1,7-bisphosphate phosphatase